MKGNNESISRRTLLASAAVGVVGTVVTATLPAAAAERGSAIEQAAIKVVRELTEAYANRDIDRVVSLVSDDVVFKDTPTGTEIHGVEAFKKDLIRFMNGPIAKDLTFGKELTRAHAVGGPGGTVVLIERNSYLSRGGKQVAIPLGAVYWVVNGKIKGWQGYPLIVTGSMGGPPNPPPGP